MRIPIVEVQPKVETTGGSSLKLNVSTCQFPVSSDLEANARYVLRQMRKAKESGAHVAHFAKGLSRATPEGTWIRSTVSTGRF